MALLIIEYYYVIEHSSGSRITGPCICGNSHRILGMFGSWPTRGSTHTEDNYRQWNLNHSWRADMKFEMGYIYCWFPARCRWQGCQIGSFIADWATPEAPLATKNVPKWLVANWAYFNYYFWVDWATLGISQEFLFPNNLRNVYCKKYNIIYINFFIADNGSTIMVQCKVYKYYL